MIFNAKARARLALLSLHAFMVENVGELMYSVFVDAY